MSAIKPETVEFLRAIGHESVPHVAAQLRISRQTVQKYARLGAEGARELMHVVNRRGEVQLVWRLTPLPKSTLLAPWLTKGRRAKR